MKIFKRSVEKNILSWKNNSLRKPMLLLGARQVGKTSFLNYFGKNHFLRYLHIDFIKMKSLHSLFENDLDPRKIVRELELRLNVEINESEDLIIFDEIQACPKAFTALKYFAESDQTYYLIAAGSLLGVFLEELSDGFPVGKVETQYMMPLSFFEFVHATKGDRLYFELINISRENPPSKWLHQKLLEALFEYYVVGGLPEVVDLFDQNKESPLLAFRKVRELQNELIENYKGDVAKHSGKLKAVRIESTLNAVVTQLAMPQTENKKFVFKDVLKGVSNYQELVGPIEWLLKAGLIKKVPIIETSQVPLMAFSKENRFKLYFFDVGLLGAMLNLSPQLLLAQNYGQFKGYFAENFVLNELICKTVEENKREPVIFCWQKSKAEIEFVMNSNHGPIPIEVKAGKNLKSKSLAMYRLQNNPNRSYLVSLDEFSIPDEDYLTRFIPLYLTQMIKVQADIIEPAQNLKN